MIITVLGLAHALHRGTRSLFSFMESLCLSLHCTLSFKMCIFLPMLILDFSSIILIALSCKFLLQYFWLLHLRLLYVYSFSVGGIYVMLLIIRQPRRISGRNIFYGGVQILMIMDLVHSRIQDISGNNKIVWYFQKTKKYSR